MCLNALADARPSVAMGCLLVTSQMARSTAAHRVDCCFAGLEVVSLRAVVAVVVVTEWLRAAESAAQISVF